LAVRRWYIGRTPSDGPYPLPYPARGSVDRVWV